MKRFVISAVSLALIVFIVMFVFLPLPGHIPVLMYHFIYPESDVGPHSSSLNVSIGAFEKQMWFLKTFGYHTLSLDEYNEIKTGLRKPKGKEILITFDDGHRTYLQYALPVLERHELKSTQFLVWQWLTGNSKDYIHLKEAKELSKNPLVDLGSHTMTHPNLTKVSLSRAQTEIKQSKDYLQKALKKEIKYLCYPEGGFNPEIIRFVKEAGYQMAFRTSLKFFNSYPETPYSIVRTKISPKYNLFVFWIYVSGLGSYAKKIDHFFHQLTLRLADGKLSLYQPHSGTS